MTIASDTSEVQSLELKLRLASDPRTGAYEVVIEFSDIGVVVEVLDIDLRRAIRTAADRSAERLRDQGYLVTSADVIGALEDALESSDLVRTSTHASN
jgi:hypothetical protein